MPKSQKEEKREEKLEVPEIKEPPIVDINLNTKDDSLKELIEKNIKWSQVIYEQNRKIKRRLTMMAILSYLKLALILAPIIIGIIYLPPLLEQLLEQYSSILGIVNGGQALSDDVLSQIPVGSLDEILSQISGLKQ